MSDHKILLNFEYVKGRNSSEVYICCPFHERHPVPDTGFKMGLNVRTGIYHCHYCGAKPSLTGNIKNILDLHFEEPPPPELEDLRARLIPKTSADVELIDLDEISWVLSPETPIAYKYIRDRGFTDDEIKKYSLRVGKIDRWAGRVIFPLFVGDECRYLVGRSYAGREPRYYNLKIPKSNFLYGIDMVEGDEVILTEGIISGIAASRVTGVSFVSMLGKGLSAWQLDKLRCKVSKVYLTLDGSGVEKHERTMLLKSLMKAGFEVFNVKLPKGKDPDDLKESFNEHFQAAEKMSKVLDL